MEEEETSKPGDTYLSDNEEIEEELEDLMEEEEEDYENIEIEQDEGDEELEDTEHVDEDVYVEEGMEDGDATPVDEDDFDVVEDSEEEQSDYEEEISIPRRTRGIKGQRIMQKSQQNTRSRQKQTELQQRQASITSSSRKKAVEMIEPSLSAHDNRILTKRQRAKLDDNYDLDLLQLPMEPMKKKHLTEEEMLLKKSEIARRRKHQSIQRAEQDKMDTINRLLKKQASKKRSKDQDETDSVQNKDDNSTNPITTSTFHYVNNKDGCTLSIPPGVEIPIIFAKGPNYPPPVPLCSISDCQNPKKYRVVKTSSYACSMEHLKLLESSL